MSRQVLGSTVSDIVAGRVNRCNPVLEIWGFADDRLDALLDEFKSTMSAMHASVPCQPFHSQLERSAMSGVPAMPGPGLPDCKGRALIESLGKLLACRLESTASLI